MTTESRSRRNSLLPGAVPEIPVTNIHKAAAYYRDCLGFEGNCGDDGFGQFCRDSCRLFLTDTAFRAPNPNANAGPTVIWVNLEGRSAVDELYEEWKSRGARIFYPPEDKPWNLHEFAAQDLDGNILRVFYDFNWELRDRDGR